MKILTLSLILALSACQNMQTDAPQLTAKKVFLRSIAIQEKSKGNITTASTLDSQIMNLEPKEPDSFINLSTTLHKAGHKTDSLEVLEIGEKLNPGNEKLKLAAAIQTIENNKPEEGIAKLKTIKTLRNKDYYNALGVANDLAGNHEDAQEAFEDGLEVAPDNGLLLNNLALSYIHTKDYDVAIDILKGLVKRDPKPKYRQNLAMAYGVSAKPEEARKLLLKDLSKKEAEANLKAYKQMRKDQSE